MKVLAALLVLTCAAGAFSERIICYYGSWSVYRYGNGKFVVEDIDPNVCTHIVYSFVGITSDANVRWLDEWNDIGDEWKVGAVTKLMKLKEVNPSLKIIIAIGGWNEGSESYSRVMSDDSLLNRFVDNAVNFVVKYNFDGFDLDWEYPTQRGGAPTDNVRFTLLCKLLADKLHSRGKELSAAVSANCEVIPVAYEVAKISQYLDSINVMTYDLHGSWESVTGHNAPLGPYRNDPASEQHLNVESAVNCWLSEGASPQKISLGLASYGRSFQLSNPNDSGMRAPSSGPAPAGKNVGEAGFLPYNEICAEESTWKITRDPDIQAPFAVRNGVWVGYDDPESLVAKVGLIKRKGLGGAMLWSIETDDFKGLCGRGKYPLLNAIKSALNNGAAPPATTQAPPATTQAPTNAPTQAPTNAPTQAPTNAPTQAPTNAPTQAPTTNAPTQAPTQTQQPPTVDISNCKGVGTTFRDPDDCSVFYTCTASANGGYTLNKTTCPRGTAYNASLGVCDYINRVAC